MNPRPADPPTVPADGATDGPVLAIPIPEHLQGRLVAFRRVVEAVLEEAVPDDEYLGLLLDRAITLMLAELLPHEASALLEALQGLAAKHPTEVFAYVAEVLRSGAEPIDRVALRGRIGFRPAAADREPG